MTNSERPTMIEGSCFCGQCSYEALGKLFDALNCHCSNCRKLTGATFSTYGAVLKDQFNWLCEQTRVRQFWSSQNVCRYFCNICGAMMASIDQKEPNSIYLSVGLLKVGTIVKPEYHEYVASKATWYDIKDDLPQFMAESST